MFQTVLKPVLTLAHLLLVFVVLAVSRVLSLIVTSFYFLFPMKPLLDRIYQRSHGVRSFFSLHLRGTPQDIVSLVEESGPYCVEHHSVTTKDGYVLGLHRIRRRVPGRRSTECSDALDRVGKQQHPSSSSLSLLASNASATSVTSAAGATSGTGNGTGTTGDDTGGSLSQLLPSSSSSFSSSSSPPTPPSHRRPAVLLQHGLMQNSECWVLGDKTSALAFALFDAGFDVWLGNNRGNKYSTKHLTLTPDSDEFWNFSLDELARYDVPAMIEYVVTVAGVPKLSYVGFSQGTAQFFATLASCPEVSPRVSSFAALSAAVTVRGLSPSLLTSLVEANHDFLFFLFGRRAMLPMALTYADMLNPKRYRLLIDHSVKFLFGWTCAEMSVPRREKLYRHLYSTSSVKAVVHWFQIMRTGRFQMYDDGQPTPHRVPPVYDVSTNPVPTAVFIGGRDTVIDPDRLVEVLPKSVAVHHMPTYEHLDMMWADSAGEKVFPAVISFLRDHLSTDRLPLVPEAVTDDDTGRDDDHRK